MMDWGCLDLAALQNDLEGRFDAWNAALALGANAAARARKALMAEVRKRLYNVKATRARGIYALSSVSTSSGIGGLRYIGCAHQQTMAKRVESYLRDDSCLDRKLFQLPDADAAQLIERRLLLTMPKSKKIPYYVARHLRTRELTAAGGIFFARLEAEPNIIRATEGALVATSWALGAPLRNAEVTCLPSSDLRPHVLSLALNVTENWRMAGLPRGVTSLITNQLNALLGEV